jgi:hypothetical protein
MNSAKIDMPTCASAGYVKLKEILQRFNMPYEERKVGNAVVIDIKARTFAPKEAGLYDQPRNKTAG